MYYPFIVVVIRTEKNGSSCYVQDLITEIIEKVRARPHDHWKMVVSSTIHCHSNILHVQPKHEKTLRNVLRGSVQLNGL